nr:MAG TPA: hypothetical protein [Caudoviricetes sp.]
MKRKSQISFTVKKTNMKTTELHSSVVYIFSKGI